MWGNNNDIKQIKSLSNQIRQIAENSKDLKDKVEAIRYISFDSARPLAEEVMGLYRGSSFDPVADSIRAYNLSSNGAGKANAIPIMHLFADAAMNDTDGMTDIFRNKGFHGRYGNFLQTLLCAHRMIAKSLVAEAIGIAGWKIVNAKKESGLRDKDDINALLSMELARAVDHIDGLEFLRLAEILSQATLLKSVEPIIKRGTITGIDITSNNIIIRPEESVGEIKGRYLPGLNIGDIVEYTIDAMIIPGKNTAVVYSIGTVTSKPSLRKNAWISIESSGTTFLANERIFSTQPQINQMVRFKAIKNPNQNYPNQWCAYDVTLLP